MFSSNQHLGTHANLIRKDVTESLIQIYNHDKNAVDLSLIRMKIELDIWLKAKEYCGKGYGIRALVALCDYLKQEFNIHDFIIRPAAKNIRAIRAYEKAGFQKVQGNDKEKTVKEFLLTEYLNEYGSGDYGFEDTEVLTLHL